MKSNSHKKVLSYNGTFLFCIFKLLRLINNVPKQHDTLLVDYQIMQGTHDFLYYL